MTPSELEIGEVYGWDPRNMQEFQDHPERAPAVRVISCATEPAGLYRVCALALPGFEFKVHCNELVGPLDLEEFL